jgi:hypothetical protein
MNLLFEIDEYPGYFVGTDLNIYSEKQGSIKMMKSEINTKGYYIVQLYNDGRNYRKLVHRLIAKMFIPNPNNLEQIDHINQNRSDNRLENLRWVSRKDNNRNRCMNKNNTTGNQGVFFRNDDYDRWIADWTDNQGKRRTKSFSIKKYGDNAKQLAIDFRKMKVDEFYNRPKNNKNI